MVDEFVLTSDDGTQDDKRYDGLQGDSKVFFLVLRWSSFWNMEFARCETGNEDGANTHLIKNNETLREKKKPAQEMITLTGPKKDTYR